MRKNRSQRLTGAWGSPRPPMTHPSLLPGRRSLDLSLDVLGPRGEPGDAVVVSHLLPLVSGRRLRHRRLLADVDDDVLGLDASLHLALRTAAAGRWGREGEATVRRGNGRGMETKGHGCMAQ